MPMWQTNRKCSNRCYFSINDRLRQKVNVLFLYICTAEDCRVEIVRTGPSDVFY